MKIKLSIITLVLLFSLSLHSCKKETSVSTMLETQTKEEEMSTVLENTEDFGQEYIDSFIFVGESTTYHLKNRGVLSGGTDTTQVWGTSNGTINLDSTTTSIKIFYPETEEYITIAEAASKKKPEYMLLTFGLNGAVQKVAKGSEYYKSCYSKLLDAIMRASPNTKIILQSAFPVASNMDMRNYSVSLDELNTHIDTINKWTLELSEEYGLRYLNTSEILKDENGRLKFEYQNGDGHHLTRKAYVEILNYIRTHGYK